MPDGIDFEEDKIDFQPDAGGVDFEPEPDVIAPSGNLRAPTSISTTKGGDRVALAPAGESIGEVWEEFNRPTIDPSPEAKRAIVDIATALIPGKAGEVAKGVNESLLDVGLSFTSPFGVATASVGALPKTAGKVVAGAFGVDMGRHVPELARTFGETSVTGDTREIAKAGSDLAVTTLMSAGAGAHALSKRGVTAQGQGEPPLYSPLEQIKTPVIESSEKQPLQRNDLQEANVPQIEVAKLESVGALASAEAFKELDAKLPVSDTVYSKDAQPGRVTEQAITEPLAPEQGGEVVAVEASPRGDAVESVVSPGQRHPGDSELPTGNAGPARVTERVPVDQFYNRITDQIEGKLRKAVSEKTLTDTQAIDAADHARTKMVERYLDKVDESTGTVEVGEFLNKEIDQRVKDSIDYAKADKRQAGELDAPPGEEAGATVKDTLVDEAITPDQQAKVADARSILDNAMRDLSPQEQRILRMIQNDDVAASVAKELGISASRVSQLKEGVLEKMRVKLEELGIEGAGDVLGLQVPLPPAMGAAKGPTTPAPAVKPITLQKVQQAAVDAIMVAGGASPIRMNRFLQKAFGVFKEREGVIRIKDAADLPAMTHEVGHGLQKALYDSAKSSALGQLPLPVQTELAALGQALYGRKKPIGGYQAEGFAEFIRYSLTTPHARTYAPLTTRYFENHVLAGNKRLTSAMLNLKDSIHRWENQGAHNRVEMQLDKGPSRWEQVKQKVEDTFTYENWVDELNPLKTLAQAFENTTRPLKPSENPYQLASWLRGNAGARVDQWVKHGMTDFWGNVTGPGLEQITAIIKGRKMEFSRYLYARRAIKLAGANKNAGIDVTDAQTVVRDLQSAQFDLAANQLYEWQRGVLRYLKETDPSMAPLIDKLITQDMDYVPLNRVFDDAKPKTAKEAAQSAGNGTIMQLDGSWRAVKDIFPSILDNTQKMVAMANRKKVLSTIVQIAKEGENLGYLIEEVPRGRIQEKFNFEQIRNDLEKLGVDTTNVPLDEMMSFYSFAKDPKTAEPIVAIRSGGETKWYHVDPKLYKTIAGMEIERMGPIADLFMGKPARAFRLGTTGLRPSFSLWTNVARDVMTYGAQSKEVNPLKLAGAYIEGMKGAILGSEHAKVFYQLGAHMAQPLAGDVNVSRRSARGLFKGKTMKVVSSPIEHLRDAFGITEAAPRIAELKLVADKVGWKPGQTITPDQAVQMGLSAKRVTVDFSAGGAIAKRINQAVPFFNASIQGSRSFARALRDNPKRAIAYGLATFTIPTLINWYRNRDKEWYKDLPPREKFLYWNIEQGDNVIQIPRPYEWGNFFAVLPEAVFDAAYRENPEAVKEALDHILETTNPSDAPVLARAAYEQARNKSLFFDQPIVPRNQVDLPPGEQRGPYTSKAAEALGDAFPDKVSPRRVDAAVRQVGGGALPEAMDLVGVGRTAKDRDAEPSDVPVVGKAFRRGGQYTGNSKPIGEFWDDYVMFKNKSLSKTNPLNEEQRRYWAQLQGAHAAIRQLQDQAQKEKNFKARQELYKQMAERAEAVTSTKPKNRSR